MSRILRGFLAGAVSAIVCTAASAQIIAIPLVTWKYQQPWTKPWHSFASVVQSCQGNPVTFAPVAADDWICTASGPIVRVQWWGTSPQPNQTPNRQFLIRIFSDQQCRPTSLLYSTCVLATNQPVSLDCRDRRVYRFSANLPTGTAGFSQVAGTHYWLMIAEVDGTPGGIASPTIGGIDFEWSAHRNISNCPALQRTPGGAFIQPLRDACDQIEEDLSFVLYRSGIIIHLPAPTHSSSLPFPTFTAEFRNLQGELISSECVSPDDDGSACLNPELGPGQYKLAIRGMCFRPSFFDVFIDVDTGPVTGGGTVGAADYFMDLGNVVGGAGDVDGDGDADFADLTSVLANWHP